MITCIHEYLINTPENYLGSDPIEKKLKSQPLRIGVLVKNSVIPEWQHTLIAKLSSLDHSSCVIIFIDGSTEHGNIPNQRRPWIYNAFTARDTRSNFVRPNALEDTSIFRGSLKTAQTQRIGQDKDKHSPEWTAEIISNAREYDLSVVLALGSDWPIEELGSIAKFGVWYFEFGEGRASQLDDSVCGFWEVVRREASIRSRLLVRLPGSTVNRVAYETHSGIDHCSHFLCRNEHLWKLCNVVPRVLRRLDSSDDENLRYLESCNKSEKHEDYVRHAALSTVNVLLPLPRYVLWRLWRKLTWALFTEHWNLSFKFGGDTWNFSDYMTITPDAGRFWADPHVLYANGGYHVFFEDASVHSGKGHISVMSSADGKTFDLPQPIIEQPYHLSYPFVFEWQDDFYLIPESAENETIELYKCKQFPDSWELDRVLMEDVLAYDATLFHHDSKWWMFVNICEQAGASSWDELCIFSSDSPLSRDWRPHPLNPVISDVRQARSAGRIFKEGDKYYRPSQDSSRRYGYGLKLNEITILTETRYEERSVANFEPNWSPFVKAIHSFSKAGDLTFIDIIAQRWKSKRRIEHEPESDNGVEDRSGS